MNTTPSTKSLLEMLSSGALLLDVRLPEDYEKGHLPSAKSNCVFEVAFADRLAELSAKKEQTIIVYGANASSYESRIAAEKLNALGFTDVHDYRIGIAGWIGEKQELEGNSEDSETSESSPRLVDGRHNIDTDESRINWTGRNLLNKHHGEIAIDSGWLEFGNARLTGGEFTIDMRSIQCSDLADDPSHEVLIHHLASDDFFDVEKFPTATFTILSATEIPHSAAGQPNLQIDGTLILKGNAVPVSLRATTGINHDGIAAAQATLSIDRTLWGVIYGSGQFFSRIGGHLVNDMIDLELRILTTAP